MSAPSHATPSASPGDRRRMASAAPMSSSLSHPAADSNGATARPSTHTVATTTSNVSCTVLRRRNMPSTVRPRGPDVIILRMYLTVRGRQKPQTLEAEPPQLLRVALPFLGDLHAERQVDLTT